MRNRWIETVWQDFRYAWRMLWRSPGTSAVALLSLMLGIGASSAIFSVVYAVLINPYPYAKPDEIWAPGVQAVSGRGGHRYSPDDYLELRKLSAVADVMATSFESVLLTGEFAPESFGGVLLTGNAFQFLGVPPIIGRALQPSDIGPDGEPTPVVVLSYRLWVRLFDGNPNAVGRTLRLNDRPHTIVGVMPPRFGWYGNDGFWLPLGPTSRTRPGWLNPILRLKPGVSPDSARDQLHALHLRLAKDDPTTFPRGGFRTNLINYMEITVARGEMQTTLQLLFGAVGLLLLIACANVANLQLARATTRTREMAVRLSIGAARGRLFRQLLTESVVLALIGGALGVLFAFVATRAIVALMPEFYVPNEARVTINGPVLVFSLSVAVCTGVLFGLAPALQSSKPDLNDGLKESSRGAGAGPRGRRLRSLLVVAEVTLSVVLLVSAGLTIRSFIALQQLNLGFEVDHALRVGIPLSLTRYTTLAQRNAFAERLLERVGALPGIESVAMGNGGLPFAGPGSPYTIEGHPEAQQRSLSVNFISLDYLRTAGIPLRRGRELTADEIRRGDRVALINEAARRLWPAGEDPIGRRIRLGILSRQPAPSTLVATGPTEVTVVGIIGDTRSWGLKDAPEPAVHVPYTLIAPPERTLAIRSKGDPALSLNALREQVRALDAELPLSRAMTFGELVDTQVVQPRFTMALFAVFAALGFSLTIAGIYSVLWYQVTMRTQEMGIRLALGAQRRDIVRLMLTAGCRLVAIGLLLGLGASLLATKLLRSQLFGITPNDPLSFAAVAGVLAIVAVMACYVPARRAGAVDPIRALRHE